MQTIRVREWDHFVTIEFLKMCLSYQESSIAFACNVAFKRLGNAAHF